MQSSQDDPFGTADLRARVLAAWAASPARFREDANAEEDYALGGYRDRVIVELAQNAADAATRAGQPGRLRLSLRDGTLTAANTGAPLDAAGVAALSTLRASGKRDEPGEPGQAGPAGRFGVGFAAAAAVSDEPRICSASGAVAWSRQAARDLVAAVPALAGELAARSGHLPVLRLPFAAAGAPPDGFVTEVVLPLRDEAALALVRRLLAETGPALLLGLPALTEVEIAADGTSRLLTARRDGDLATITSDGVAGTWRTAARAGRADPALLADRPAEERARPAWSACWAVPVAADGATPAGKLPGGVSPVLHAPTPTDEPLDLPALLAASFPVSPDRRHVAPGPLTDFLIEQAAAAYAGLLPRLAPGPGLLDLVPGPVGAGELDARLRGAILARLPDTAFLPAARADDSGEPAEGNAPAGRTDPESEAEPRSGALPGWDDPDSEAEPRGPGALPGWDDPDRRGGPDGPAPDDLLQPGSQDRPPGPDQADLAADDLAGSGPRAGLRVRPRDAVVLEATAPGLASWLAPVLPGLVDGPARHPAYGALGIRRLRMADLADALAGLEREPAWWHRLYTALAGLEPGPLGDLGALPVPLADGRLVRGPRGLLLPGQLLTGPGQAGELAVLGLRVVHPEAAHPLLARLGAIEATPRGVLADPAVRAAVAASADEDDPEPIADAVLSLAAAARLRPGELPWLAGLTLPGADGDWYPADELLLPGGPLAGVVAADAPFGTASPDLVARHGADALEAVGVLGTFGLLTVTDVALDDPDLDLDGVADWAADVRDQLPEGDVPPVAAEVAAVRDLELVDPGRWPQALELLSRPPLRAALTEPVRVLLADGRRVDAPSYTAWWLRQAPVLGGRRPAELRAAGASLLLSGLYDELPGPVDPEVARALGVRTTVAALLAEPGGADDLLDRLADPDRPVTRPQLRALWAELAAAPDATPPDRVRAVLGSEIVVADAADALILDAPDLLPLAADRPLILAPHDRAARLADLLDVPLASEECPGQVGSAGQRRPVPDVARQVLPGAPAQYLAHDALTVDGVAAAWRYAGGEVHAAGPGGLACGLAWAAGRWAARHLLTAVLADPGAAPRLLAEADLDPGLDTGLDTGLGTGLDPGQEYQE